MPREPLALVDYVSGLFLPEIFEELGVADTLLKWSEDTAAHCRETSMDLAPATFGQTIKPQVAKH